MPDRKPSSDHASHIRALRAMTAEQRLMKAFELSDMTRDAIRQELLSSNPELSQQELARLVRRRLDFLQSLDR